MIFVEDAEESSNLKSATKSNAPKAPRSDKKDKLRLRKNEANYVQESCQKSTPEYSSNTPTLDGQPNRLYISSPKCETPSNNFYPPARTPIAVSKPQGEKES